MATVTHTSGTTTTTDAYTPDAAGNTTTRPGQTLTYNPRGKLTALAKTGTGEQQSNIYDTEGDLLVQIDPAGDTTAFLGDTLLRVAPGSTTVSASRTYTIGGVASAERNTVAGVAGSTLYFLDADPLGTAGH